MTLSREFFDTLIIIVVLIGSALTIVRLYQDFTRPLPRDPRWDDKRQYDGDSQ